MGDARVTLETKIETAGIQTGMAPKEQDGEETNNYDDLMQVQRPLYSEWLYSPNLISIIFDCPNAGLRIDVFAFP